MALKPPPHDPSVPFRGGSKRPPPHDPVMPFRGGTKPPKTKAPIPTAGSATGPHPPIPVPPPLTEAQLIQQMVTAAQLPALQAIQNAQADSARAAKNQQTTTTGYYQALAQILQGIGPATQEGYQQAAGADAAFGKGFSDGLAQVQGQMQDQSNAALNVAGAPASQAQEVTNSIGGTGATDALYGVGGYIPASTMTREGAAFGAAANLLPATAAGQGAFTIRDIGRQQAIDQQGFTKQLSDLAAQVPGLSMQFGQQIGAERTAAQAHEDRVRAAAVHEADVRRNQQISYILATGTDANGNLTPKARSELARALGYDPVTGKPTASTTAAQTRSNVSVASYNLRVKEFNAKQASDATKLAVANPSQSKLRGYLVDGRGNAIPDAKGNIQVIAGWHLNPQGKPVKDATSSSTKLPKPADITKQVALWATGKPQSVTEVKLDADGNPIPSQADPNKPVTVTSTKAVGRLDFGQAYKKLMAMPGMTDKMARKYLDAAYARGTNGRAWLTNVEQSVLSRAGVRSTANIYVNSQGKKFGYLTTEQTNALKKRGHHLPPGHWVNWRSDTQDFGPRYLIDQAF